MSHVDRVAHLIIQLDGWQPVIWRRVETPLTATLKALHDLIQAAMPFDDAHLFEFRTGGKRYAIPNPDWDSLRERPYSAKTMKLGTLVDRGVSQIAYVYDFGEDWRHTITIEAIADAAPGVEYPRYIDGAGRAPPEDVGGLSGFEVFLQAIANPDHELHRELTQWHGRVFDPEYPDENDIRRRIGKLAKRRKLGRAGFAKSRNQTH